MTTATKSLSPLSLNEVHDLLSRRFKDFKIERYSDHIEMRKGLNKGVNVRINYDGGDDRITALPRSYLDVKSKQIVSRVTLICSMIGLVVGVLFFMDARMRLLWKFLSVACGFGCGGGIGFFSSFIWTAVNNTHTHEKQNREFCKQVVSFVNANAK